MLTSLLWLSLIPLIPYGFFAMLWMPLWLVLFCLAAILLIVYILKKAIESLEIGDLEQKAVFITGCDTGFGNLLALKCLQRGMPVFAGCLTEKGAEALKTEASSLPGKLHTIIVNVADDESVKEAVEVLDRETKPYGGLHSVVNNAGIVGSAFFDDMLTIEHYKKVAEVNTFGVIRVTQMTKHLVKKARPDSDSGFDLREGGIIGCGPYTVSKYAVSGYCEVIRQELRHFGVSVHILEPGFFKTPLIDAKRIEAQVDEVWKNVPQTIKDEYGEDFYKKARASSTDFLSKIGSDRVEVVVNGYFHAITARFPRLRYQLGLDAEFFFVPISHCPTGFRDTVFHVLQTLQGAPIPAAAQKKHKTHQTHILIDK